MFLIDKDYQYIPVLSISRAEMKALEELPEKDKDNLLPLFPLKGWASAKTLDKALARIKTSFGNRRFIADIDSDFLVRAYSEVAVKDEPREVFKEIIELANSDDGYDNWYQFIKQFEHIHPCVQLNDLSQVKSQVKKLKSLGRRICVYLKLNEVNTKQLVSQLDELEKTDLGDALFVIDFGDITHSYEASLQGYAHIVEMIHAKFPQCYLAVSATSFPYGFSGQNDGEASIYERQLYQKISDLLGSDEIVYSDRGSARAGKLAGGSGTPPPRIDYACKTEWRFIREEFDDSSDIGEGEKAELYSQIAKEMMDQDYWIEELSLWGTQMIELAARGDEFGITNAQDATAVRINLHLYQQLHFSDVNDVFDTDEDWVD
ncbi:beta family protein [Alteromonas sp. A079]|uniref:beta family protein n=1 Tax=Alteromonas sp. A079 TaxID=3410268 RepID=UPI003BA23B32